MSLRAKRIILRIAFHSGVMLFVFIGVIAGALADNAGTSGFFALALVAYLATMRVNPLPKLLERKLLQVAECSACGEAVALVGTWSCRCGFSTWEPRHALSPCPVCKRDFEWVHCPRCDSGIRT
ncbi:MAG: hypothetical protein L0177_08615 [Chloroflexi bacterium]|nr:hypothetical protein [Chloroflexota bacterium]